MPACNTRYPGVTNSAVTAPLRKHEANSVEDPPISQARAQAAMIAECTDYHAPEPHSAPDRRLRNHVLLANAAAWTAIILLIRFLFF